MGSAYALSDLETILADHAEAHDDDEVRAECGITFGMMRDAVTLAALKAVPPSNSPWEVFFSAIDGMGQWAPTVAVIKLHRHAVAAALHQAAPEQPPILFSLKEKADGQVAYWRERQEAEKCFEDGMDGDGVYTPIGDQAAWQGGYCNGRMSEADWWLKTFRAMATASPPASGQQQASSCESTLTAADRAAEIMHAISQCGAVSLSNDRWCLGHELITKALLSYPAGQSAGQSAGQAGDAGADARTVLTEACKPWEHYTGEPPDDGSPLSGVFVAGMVYTERLLAKLLDVTHYEGGDGSEDFDNDATQTLRNILTGAGLWDADENRAVKPAPDSTRTGAAESDDLSDRLRREIGEIRTMAADPENKAAFCELTVVADNLEALLPAADQEGAR